MRLSLSIALLASLVWAIAGANAGMHLAVAPATSAYRSCMETTRAEQSECRATLYRDWSTYGARRLPYAAMLGLAPIPIAWLIGWFLVGNRRSANDRQRNQLVVSPAQ